MTRIGLLYLAVKQIGNDGFQVSGFHIRFPPNTAELAEVVDH
jgi:hypothetical protein